MKVVLYMAQTINGVVARQNYEEDFLSHKNWEVFTKLAEDIGCFVVGRKTYEEVRKWEGYNFDDVKAKKLVVSRDKGFKPASGYIPAYSPRNALEKASRLGFSRILLTGGGTLNSAFMKAGLVYEIIINIEPYVLGRGIRIFSEETFESELLLIKMKKLNGIIQLHYKVNK